MKSRNQKWSEVNISSFSVVMEAEFGPHLLGTAASEGSQGPTGEPAFELLQKILAILEIQKKDPDRTHRQQKPCLQKMNVVP